MTGEQEILGIKRVSASYPLVAADAILRDIFVETAAAELTVTLLPPAKWAGRHLTIYKTPNSGAGEVKLAMPDGTLFNALYPNLWVGLAGQHAELYSDGLGIYCVGGNIQPVALEPDTGGGIHWRLSPTIWDTLNLGPAVVWTDVNISAKVPLGSRTAILLADAEAVSAAAGDFYNVVDFRKKGTLLNPGYCVGQHSGRWAATAAGKASGGRGLVFVELDSSRIFQYANEQGNAGAGSGAYVTTLGYVLGPA